jgi:hypothetical protein
VLDRSGAVLRSVTGQQNRSAGIAQQIGRYIYEPDAAILAARLAGELAAVHSLQRVAANVAYLTADSAISDPALTTFEVDNVLPFDRRQLRDLLASRHIGRLEIKKRAIDVDPQLLRRELKLRGDKAATLILAPHGSRQIAILCHRLAATAAT